MFKSSYSRGRQYYSLCSADELREYAKEHTRAECAEHFGFANVNSLNVRLVKYKIHCKRKERTVYKTKHDIKEISKLIKNGFLHRIAFLCCFYKIIMIKYWHIIFLLTKKIRMCFFI